MLLCPTRSLASSRNNCSASGFLYDILEPRQRLSRYSLGISTFALDACFSANVFASLLRVTAWPLLALAPMSLLCLVSISPFRPLPHRNQLPRVESAAFSRAFCLVASRMLCSHWQYNTIRFNMYLCARNLVHSRRQREILGSMDKSLTGRRSKSHMATTMAEAA